MKAYLKPEVEQIVFSTESITDVSMGNTPGGDPDDMD